MKWRLWRKLIPLHGLLNDLNHTGSKPVVGMKPSAVCKDVTFVVDFVDVWFFFFSFSFLKGWNWHLQSVMLCWRQDKNQTPSVPEHWGWKTELSIHAVSARWAAPHRNARSSWTPLTASSNTKLLLLGILNIQNLLFCIFYIFKYRKDKYFNSEFRKQMAQCFKNVKRELEFKAYFTPICCSMVFKGPQGYWLSFAPQNKAPFVRDSADIQLHQPQKSCEQQLIFQLIL